LLRYLWKQKTNKKQKMTKISKTRQNKLFVGHKFNLVSQWCFVRFWRLCSTFWKACLFPIRKQKNIFREKFFFSWKKYFFWNFVIPSKLFFGKFWASLSTWYNNDSKPGKKEKKLFYCCCLWDSFLLRISALMLVIWRWWWWCQ